MGLLSKKESYNQMVERFQRSNEAGDYLHTNYLQDLKNFQIEHEIPSSGSTPDSQDEGNTEINPFGFLGKK